MGGVQSRTWILKARRPLARESPPTMARAALPAFDATRVPSPVSACATKTAIGDPATSAYPRFRVSDTGVFSSEYQNTIGMVNTFVRYARRENVEAEHLAGTYTQHDGSALAFVNVSRTLSVLRIGDSDAQHAATGEGSSFFQYGGGGQAQLMRRGLWLRAEGLAEPQRRYPERPHDSSRPVQFWPEWRDRPEHDHRRQRLRRPILQRRSFPATDPWTLRSTLRVSRNFPPAADAPADTSVLGDMSRHGGNGSVVGSVFADWNGNGMQDRWRCRTREHSHTPGESGQREHGTATGSSHS